MTCYPLDAGDMAFLAAAESSDDILELIGMGWQPPYSMVDLEEVRIETYERALREIREGLKP